MKAYSIFLLLFFLGGAADAQVCDSTLWKHIYSKKRLEILKDCISARGTITHMGRKPDGDWHILLQLDAGQDSLLNAGNRRKTKGCLVVEVICANKVYQPGVVKRCKACRDCKKRIIIPKKGAHVKVNGSFVKDKWHGWNEIHPVSAIELLPPL